MLDGVNVATQIYWEASQSKGTVTSPQKYVDASFQKEALKELATR